MHARVEELLGPFDAWQVCPHDERDGCACRKPAPGLVHAAARALGTGPPGASWSATSVADMTAAAAAGAAGVLVPTPVTRPEEVGRRARGRRRPAGGGGGDPATGQAAVRPGAAPRRRAGTRPGGAQRLRRGRAGHRPGIRAVAAGADRVVLLCGPRGRAAADLLPGVDEIVEWPLPWIDGHPAPVDPDDMRRLTARLTGVGADEAVVFTSFHQSPLPLALLLRMAGVPRISAISDDYPGALLDVRHRVPGRRAGARTRPVPGRRRRLRHSRRPTSPACGCARTRLPARPAGPGEPRLRGAAPRLGRVETRACPPELAARIVRALTRRRVPGAWSPAAATSGT